MNPIVRNIIAVVAGAYIGSHVNGDFLMSGMSIIPAPEGVNPMDVESIKANMHLYEFKHFVTPFLAHALGTFVGAFVTSLLAASHTFKFAMAIGCLFLIGGIMMVFMLPAPIWFIISDLALAYIPMGYLGWKLAGGK